MPEITLYTIGFTKKSAEVFFGKIQDVGVQRVIDIRLNNTRQFAGFTKKNDLLYFLKTICGCNYRHEPLLAPSKQIFDGYKKKRIGWSEYKRQFNELLRERKPLGLVSPSELNMACLLCCEVTAENCHRRLVAEYFRDHFTGLEITHL
jgi:uncharacterized protein (DUF488 family)